VGTGESEKWRVRAGDVVLDVLVRVVDFETDRCQLRSWYRPVIYDWNNCLLVLGDVVSSGRVDEDRFSFPTVSQDLWL
jgi:hypothetical protein